MWYKAIIQPNIEIGNIYWYIFFSFLIPAIIIIGNKAYMHILWYQQRTHGSYPFISLKYRLPIIATVTWINIIFIMFFCMNLIMNIIVVFVKGIEKLTLGVGGCSIKNVDIWEIRGGRRVSYRVAARDDSVATHFFYLLR